MRKPKVANPPERIYLQVGDIDDDCDFKDISLEDVTWCADDIFETDIEYRLVRRRVYKRTAKAHPRHD